jgi:two-component SAPR family response regulator
VVIVEDEWLIVQDLEAALLDIGHLPAGSAGDVPAALALLAGLEADAALIDVELRGQTSEPIVAQCRRRGLPVIIASAHTPGQLPDFCDGLPYLGKPVHYGRLAEMLAAVS